MNISENKNLSGVWTHACEHIIVRGEGSYLYTETGEKLLDFTSGIGVNSTGHSHPKVVKAIAEQAENLIFSQINCASHNMLIELADELKTLVPRDLTRFFYAQSGSEAVEAAVKLAKHASGRPNVIVMQGSFHGRSHMTMAMTTSKTVYRLSYPNLPAGVFTTPFPYAYAWGMSEEAAARKALSELRLVLETQTAPCDTAAIFVEPVLGEGGYLPAPASYLEGLREICNEHGILLVIDEVQTGFGRTGKMFACEWSGIVPDILIMAKGMGSGLPISAIAYKEKFDEKWIKGTHGGTYGGSPMGCAAAVSTIKVLKEEKLVENALRRGEQLTEGLKKIREQQPIIGDIRGKGLMIGMEIMKGEKPDSSLPSKITKECYSRGLMLLTCGIRKNVIRWIPPLVVSAEEIEEGLSIFESALMTVQEKEG